MNILRFFLLVASIVYGIPFILKCLLSGQRYRKTGNGRAAEKRSDDYSGLTDQKIEDADYEEL